jgi:hypothetical protein
MPQETATATMEGTMKSGSPRKDSETKLKMAYIQWE